VYWARHYVGWEMLEYSNVAIPANQDIVNNAIARGLITRDLAPQFFQWTERSITPEPAKPAAPGPKAAAVELHPVLAKVLSVSINATRRHLSFLAAAEELRRAKETIDGR
jgi:hypothetical protein